MSHLHISKYLIDMFNDITMDNPEFQKRILDIYRAQLKLNKAKTPDKETSFLGLNIKII